MRELRVIGLEPDGSHVVCADASTGEKFRLPADDKLRAASRGDMARLGQIEIEMDSQLRPREIQARIRCGASVEEVAEEAGIPLSKVERFAYPVLLERSRAAELAQGGHPVLDDGPSVQTLVDIVGQAFRARGHVIEDAEWDAWRDNDNHWVAQLQWQAGRSTNSAHWRYQPDAHGGTIVALDDTAFDLIDPDFGRPLRGLAAVSSDSDQLELTSSDERGDEADADEPIVAETVPHTPSDEPIVTGTVVAETDGPQIIDHDAQQPHEPAAAEAPRTAPRQPTKDKRGKPALPSWDDVLLGVRSSGR
ncbi:septation protein SepH [Rhodococcus sp. HNM0569]|uniref:septation protein SepH n=1 Tax=Rhodococcus sp. HNM0569 TaxID=2716340 RepID=UPI003211E36D